MLRVTTGCVTCRIRRVKCDEEKPQCKRCKTTGRKCEGYVNAPLSRKGLGPTVNARLRDQVARKPGSVMLLSLSDVKFLDERESQCFDFFRTCSVPNTNLFVTDNFWSRVLLQATPAEPSIKHGILALGALHRHFETGKQEDQDYAIQQYAHAMRHMTALLSGDKADPSFDYNIVLMSIIIFHCFESHNSSYTAASLHLKAGKRLLEEANRSTRRKSPSAKSSAVIDEVTRTLHRLDVHALTYQEASAPYDWPQTLYGTNDETMPTELDGIGHARDILMALFKRSAHVAACELAQNMGKPPDIPPAELASRRLEVSADLTKWKRLMLEQLHRPETAATYPSPYSFILFECYYTVAVMNLAVSATGLETSWDLFISQCVYLVKNLAKLFGTRSPDTRSGMDRHVSYDLGIIAPLFWIAIKCRDPLVRREAIAVLSSAHRKEGKWSSFGAASVAQAVIDLEEEELGSVLKATDIPEARRVHLVQPSVDPATKFVQATFWRKSGEGGAWTSETREVRF